MQDSTTFVLLQEAQGLPVYYIILPVLLLLAFLVTSKSHKQHGGCKTLPPYANSGYIESIQKMSSNEVPSELLRWAQECKFGDSASNVSNVPLYLVRLPPSLWSSYFMICNDVTLTHLILGDHTSYKPKELYLGLLGENMFNCEGHRWKHVRKSVTMAFAHNNIKRMNDVVNLKTNELMTRVLDPCANTEKEETLVSFDVGVEMVNLTLSIISVAAFEYEMNPDEKKSFLNDIRCLFHEGRKRSIPLRRKLGHYFFDSAREARQSAVSLKELGYRILSSFREKRDLNKGTIIECIVNDMAYENDAERVNDIIVFLVAGYDTTAYSIAWTMLELAKYPKEQDSLREELKQLPMEKRHQSVMLKNVIKEGMRLHPVAALGSARKTSKDIIQKLEYGDSETEIYIPKDSTILFPYYVLMRNPKYYDEPEIFKPSRWVNPSPEATSAFTPFAVGRRNCVGQPLASAELYTVVSRLISEYCFTVDTVGTSEYAVTLKPIGAKLFVSKSQ